MCQRHTWGHPAPQQPVNAKGVLALIVLVSALAAGVAMQRGELDTSGGPNLASLFAGLQLPNLPGGGIAGGGKVCPVDGRVRFSDSWGASRGGGRRRHKGVDMMAGHGTRLVAVEAGRIYKAGDSGGIGGVRLWLAGKSGLHYYYAHLSRLNVRTGESVRRGQLVGRVGSTGNATADAPHVHFEIHPKGGRAVNPYPQVKRWC